MGRTKTFYIEKRRKGALHDHARMVDMTNALEEACFHGVSGAYMAKRARYEK